MNKRSDEQQKNGSNEFRPAIFIDRDGVVNRRRIGDYVKRREEFEFLPDIFLVLPQIHAAGYLAVLITNQQGIAKKLMSEDDLLGLHQEMQQELEERTGHRFDAIYHCPHGNNDGCDCRKPKPGMILQAAAELEINLSDSWMIGDSESDIEAGKKAGCRTIRIGEPEAETAADVLVESLTEGWQRIALSNEL